LGTAAFEACFTPSRVSGRSPTRFSPDAERFLRAYVDNKVFLHHPEFSKAIETPLDRINMMMREDGQHLWAYDIVSLSLLLQRAGFSSVTRQEFRVS
jgi:hypothetical protein